MYNRDQNKKILAPKTPYGYQPTQKTFQAQPVSAKPQSNLGSDLTQMAGGIALNKGMNAGIDKGTELAKTGYSSLMNSAMMNPAAAEAASTYGLGAEAALGSGSQAAMLAAQDAAFGGSLAAAAPATAAGTAATGGAAAGGMGAMGAGMMAAAPYVGAALVADEVLGLDLRENVLGFSQGGKVYASKGEKIKMTPEQRAAFYNLQISNGKMTPEVAEGALINEFGMRPGIAQSLIQSQYNIRQTPTGATSLLSNTPKVNNLPQSREVPMINAPVEPYDEFTQVPRALQQPPKEVTVDEQPRGQTPMPTNTGPYQRPTTTTTESIAAMEELVTPTRVQQKAASEDIGAIPGDRANSGFNMGSFLGPLALAYLIGKR